MIRSNETPDEGTGTMDDATMERPTKIEFEATGLEQPEARRGFLAKLALAAGATALAPMILRGGLGTALGADGIECDVPDLGFENAFDLTPLQILNFALLLEYLEATFYLRAEGGGGLPAGATVEQIDPEGMGEPGRVPGLASVRPPLPATFNVLQFVRTVRNHEIEHVLFLQNALGSLALDRTNVEFAFPGAFDNPEVFLATAQTLEDVGVRAYLGQVSNFPADATGLLSAAGSIALVEGEHAATFRLIRGETLTPGNCSFDDRWTAPMVLAAAGGFVSSADVSLDPRTFPTG